LGAAAGRGGAGGSSVAGRRVARHPARPVAGPPDPVSSSTTTHLDRLPLQRRTHARTRFFWTHACQPRRYYWPAPTKPRLKAASKLGYAEVSWLRCARSDGQSRVSRAAGGRAVHSICGAGLRLRGGWLKFSFCLRLGPDKGFRGRHSVRAWCNW